MTSDMGSVPDPEIAFLVVIPTLT